MRRSVARLLLIGTLGLAGAAAPVVDAQDAGGIASVRFAALDIYLDSSEPLAAWQFELGESTGSMTVVGVENGDSAAYDGAPYYDLDAVAGDRADRIVVADFSLEAPTALPSGRTRVATVHVRLIGSAAPEFELSLIAAGNAAGDAIAAEAELEFADGRTL